MISRFIQQKFVGRMSPVEIDPAHRWFGVREPNIPSIDFTHHHR